MTRSTPKRPKHPSRSSTRSSRAVLLARVLPEQTEDEVDGSLDELENLVTGLGIEVQGRFVQKRGSPNEPFGEGKLEEVASYLPGVAGGGRALVVVNEELSPGSLRATENALEEALERGPDTHVEVEVIDRTGVILRVFEERARTRVARLEVELARLTYEAPRVREDASLADREGGGGGRGERGHTNVELEKQRIRERIATLKRELESVRATEETQRARRRDAARVALVGYTNAGKSSLMRALTGSEVHVEDRLFATLGTTVRALAPETRPRILVSDTVGFIQDLPHALVASFRSTLEEAREAGLLLYVVDASDPAWRTHLDVTRRTIAQVGAGDTRSLVVLNKIDRVDDETRAKLGREVPDAILVSAHDPADVRRLHGAVVGLFEDTMEDAVVHVDYTRGELLGEIRASARVLSEVCSEDGITLALRAPPDVIARVTGALAPVEQRALEATDEVLEAARAQGLELTTDDTDFDRTGLDFLVVHARDEDGVPWVVRTPRRHEVFEGSLLEARVLALLGPRLPVAIPDWRVHTRDVIAYPRLPGTPAVTLDAEGAPSWNVIDPAALPEAFLDSMARALVALQAIPIEDARRAGVPIRSLDEVRRTHREAMEQARAHLAPSDETWARWQRWLDDDRGWPKHLALTHGDLHPGHLLLDDDARLIGVLDWTEAAFTDPSVDLAMFHGCFGRPALEALLTRFEALGGRTWPGIVEHTAERWAAFPALAAAWALRTDNPGALEHARGLLSGTEPARRNRTRRNRTRRNRTTTHRSDARRSLPQHAR